MSKDGDTLKSGKRQTFQQGTVSVGGWEWRSMEKKKMMLTKNSRQTWGGMEGGNSRYLSSDSLLIEFIYHSGWGRHQDKGVPAWRHSWV